MDPADNMLGDFRILSRIKVGLGTQGAVYKAVCESDTFPRCPRGTIVALKAMPVAAEGDALFEKLRSNVEALAGINHPNIVRYLGCFSAQVSFSEQHVVVQEFLEGETLASRLASCCGTGLDADEALRVIKGVVAGLGAAVKCGIIHRDVKPANVFLCNDRSVKLIDFEVSRRTGGSSSTTSSNMVGSFDYMAPEFTDPAFCGDERSDIFSAGVVMHEIFSGSIPYQRGTQSSGRGSISFFERWSRDSDGALSNGECRISYRIERVVSHARPVIGKALASNREARFSTFDEFAAALVNVRLRELKGGENRYQILQFIGKGGFGEVFKARQNRSDKFVAVKHLLKPEYAARFYREARIMSELRDPCFVRFLDFISIDKPGVREAFLVMEFLPGMPGNSLRDAIRRSAGNGIGFKDVIKAFVRYAHGLSVLHGRGIYHRDIKPSNLYFPEGRPDEAAIMDLGIARDENGTKTNGQVPGTLDYMPPETAFGGTRGDATMDIYALGLCLYEALTGKKAFPMLPSGNAAFAQFFQRAREKRPPTFDDERVSSNPELLGLLVRMTDPDYEKRMSNSAELEIALKRLIPDDAEGVAGTVQDDEPATKQETLATGMTVTEATETEGDADADTGETVFVRPTQILEIADKAAAEKAAAEKAAAEKAAAENVPAVEKEAEAAPAAGQPSEQKSAEKEPAVKKPSAKKPVEKQKATFRQALRGPVVIAVAAAIAALAAFGFFVVPIFGSWLDALMHQSSADATTGKMGVRVSELGIDDFYGDDAVSLEQADAVRDRWLADRRPPVLSKEEYARAVQILAEKREKRIIRERLDEERSRINAEARVVERVYRDDGVEPGDRRREEWRRAWGAAAREKVAGAEKRLSAAREARIRYDVAKRKVPEAEVEAGKISRNYTIDDLAISDRNADGWRQSWRDRLPKEDYMRIDAMLQEARERYLKSHPFAQAGGGVLDECRTLIELLKPVDKRMNRLAEAETTLQSEMAGGRIDPASAEKLLAEITERRKWTVFEVENRSDMDLEIDGETMRSGEVRMFVYTNAPPAELMAAHVGYEPFVFGPQVNGCRIVLLPEHFTLKRVPMRVGKLEDGVICRVDGILVRKDVVKLMPGSHECVYSRPDYKSQLLPFRVDSDTPSELPRPGPWVRTEEWLLRPVPVKVTLPELADGISCLIDGTPATNSAALLPGDHVCIFRRPDYFDVRHDFTVRVGEPITLPAPYKWKETEALSALVAAEVAAESGDWNQARAMFRSADVKGKDGLRRKRALGDRIEHRKRFLKRLDEAAAAYMDASWLDVVKAYAGMIAEGYVLTEEDGRRLDVAVKNARSSLEMRRQSAERSGSSMAVKKLDAEIKQLEDMVKSISKSFKFHLQPAKD